MNLIAVAEIVIVSMYLMLPTLPAANPFSDDFEWKFVNYAPIVTVGALILLTHLVARLGEEVVHRADPQHRPGRRRGLRRLSADAARSTWTASPSWRGGPGASPTCPAG